MTDKFRQLKDYLDRMNYYRRILVLLEWDLSTQTPVKDYEKMAETYAHFSTELFILQTSSELLDLLNDMSQPEEYDQLDEGMKYTVTKMKTEMDRQRRIPTDFYKKYVSAQSASKRAWEQAKKQSDFSIYAPHLDEIIRLTREKYAYTDPDLDPYEAMLNDYEKGMDSASIDRVFGEFKEGLLPLLEKIQASPAPSSEICKGFYDIEAQKKVQELLLKYIGFSFEAGAVAEYEHPFTTGFSRNDVRLTNHYYENNPISAIFSAIHEGGHGIFMQNVAPELEGTAADDCCYSGIHESQSRFYENILGRRESFWKPIYPKVQQLLTDLQKIPFEEFYREINHVQCSMIRTESDEVTYGLHIIIRYEIEQAIFRDHVPTDQLPALWNQKMQEYLHITPANDAEGILQDVHWSDGSFGYFPSYLLGNIYDGMLLQTMEAELGPVDDLLKEGEILTITHWLNDKIHRYGCLREPKDMIRLVCGKELSAAPLLEYFEKKYSRIYGF